MDQGLETHDKHTAEGCASFVSSEPNQAQPHTIVGHCYIQQCHHQILDILHRELTMKHLDFLDVVITSPDVIFAHITKYPNCTLILQACQHSKYVIKQVCQYIQNPDRLKEYVFIFGLPKTDFEDFKKFHCHACSSIQNDSDIQRLVHSVYRNISNLVLKQKAEDERCSPRTRERPRERERRSMSGFTFFPFRRQRNKVKSIDCEHRMENNRAPDSVVEEKRSRSVGYRSHPLSCFSVSSSESDAERHSDLSIPSVQRLDSDYVGQMSELNSSNTTEMSLVTPSSPYVTGVRNSIGTMSPRNSQTVSIVTCSSEYLPDASNSTGTLSLRTSCSQEKINESTDEKLKIYSRNPECENYHRDILTCIFPELRNRQDISTFSKWLRFDNCKIKQKLLLEMETLLWNIHLQNVTVDALFHAIDTLLFCCFQNIINAEDTLCLPLRVMTLCVVTLHALCSRTTKPEVHTEAQKITRKAYNVIDSLHTNSSSKTEQQIIVLLQLLEFFDKSYAQGGFLEHANSQQNIDSSLRVFKQLEYPNKFTFIFILLKKILQKTSETVEESLQAIVKEIYATMSKRHKTRQLLSPLLYFVTKALTIRLAEGPDCKKSWSETKQCLIDIINTYIMSSRVDRCWKHALLETLEPLLFITDKNIVNEIVRIYTKCDYKHSSLQVIVLKQVQELLADLNVTLFNLRNISGNLLTPVWRKYQGTIWNGTDVSLVLLQPSWNSLTKGSVMSYQNQADKKETENHMNCLDILRLLQKDRTHQNIIKLISHQYSPIPLYYLTESSKNLHVYLLEKRQCETWLPCDKLGQMAVEVVNALMHIHDKGVIHRDLTTWSFSINENDTIKLHDFNLARMLHGDYKKRDCFVNAVNDDEIPVLYSAPESIIDDRFDFHTDTWMLGLLLYSMFTHGGIPFTLQGLTTENVIANVIFHDLKPMKWPCIPHNVYEVIVSCMETDPSKRCNLKQTRIAMEGYISLHKEENLHKFLLTHDSGKIYPPPALTEPERGLPPLFSSLKQSLDPRISYVNIHKLSMRSTKCCLSLNEINSPDKPVWNLEEDGLYMLVEEPVTKSFIEEELPQMTEHLCTKVLKMTGLPLKIKQVLHQKDESFPYKLHYQCHKGENVIELALQNLFSGPLDDIMYLGVIYNLVHLVHRMHLHHWLLRDICGYSIFVDPNTLKVFIPRVGRFRRMNSTVALDDSLLDKPFRDRVRWLPVEGIQHGWYSKESDIYMLGMTIWEIYTALDMAAKNKYGNHLEGKPYAFVPKDKLIQELYNGEPPIAPSSCPLWLYEILKHCWNRNRTFRPSTETILMEIKDRIQKHPGRNRILHLINLKPEKIQKTEQITPTLKQGVTESSYLHGMLSKSVTSRFMDGQDGNKYKGRALPKTNTKKQSIDIEKAASSCGNSDDSCLRETPGRFGNQDQPSGFYDNEPDAGSPNQESLSLHKNSEDKAPFEISKDSRFFGLHNLLDAKNGTAGSSNIDSGFEETISNAQKRRCMTMNLIPAIPAIPSSKSLNIPQIPISNTKKTVKINETKTTAHDNAELTTETLPICSALPENTLTPKSLLINNTRNEKTIPEQKFENVTLPKTHRRSSSDSFRTSMFFQCYESEGVLRFEQRRSHRSHNATESHRSSLSFPGTRSGNMIWLDQRMTRYGSCDLVIDKINHVCKSSTEKESFV